MGKHTVENRRNMEGAKRGQEEQPSDGSVRSQAREQPSQQGQLREKQRCPNGGEGHLVRDMERGVGSFEWKQGVIEPAPVKALPGPMGRKSSGIL